MGQIFGLQSGLGAGWARSAASIRLAIWTVNRVGLRLSGGARGAVARTPYRGL